MSTKGYLLTFTFHCYLAGEHPNIQVYPIVRLSGMSLVCCCICLYISLLDAKKSASQGTPTTKDVASCLRTSLMERVDQPGSKVRSNVIFYLNKPMFHTEKYNQISKVKPKVTKSQKSRPQKCNQKSSIKLKAQPKVKSQKLKSATEH